MNRLSSRVLLVEGDEDKRVIPQLVERAGIDWGTKENPFVRITAYGGVNELLAAGEIEAQFKASGLLALGVIVDADENAQGRWTSIRQRIAHVYPNAPDILPRGGVVLKGALASFGAWVMPDNATRGMLETFLLYLRPQGNQKLLDLAAQAVEQAQKHSAPFLPSHIDKAKIHCWLAWQDPPGRQLHNAIMERLLPHESDCLRDFIAWFCSLYDLERT